MPLARFARPEAVVFDLDGTLVDTAPDLCGTLNRLLIEHGRPTISLDEIRPMIGDGAAKMVERGFGATGGLPDDLTSLVRRFIGLYESHVADESRPFPGVMAVLERMSAAGLRLGVCTNKLTDLSQRLLDQLDLSRHFAVVVGGDGPARKPDPQHVLTTVERLGATPETALMVGDSLNDVAAAKAARVRVVAVTFGYTSTPAAELGADAVIDSFAELPRLIGLADA
ncbi:MAG TPA: phosphoglycolate phosphatase [Alphaproteobacteria bacterium]